MVLLSEHNLLRGYSWCLVDHHYAWNMTPPTAALQRGCLKTRCCCVGPLSSAVHRLKESHTHLHSHRILVRLQRQTPPLVLPPPHIVAAPSLKQRRAIELNDQSPPVLFEQLHILCPNDEMSSCRQEPLCSGVSPHVSAVSSNGSCSWSSSLIFSRFADGGTPSSDFSPTPELSSPGKSACWGGSLSAPSSCPPPPPSPPPAVSDMSLLIKPQFVPNCLSDVGEVGATGVMLLPAVGLFDSAGGRGHHSTQ